MAVAKKAFRRWGVAVTLAAALLCHFNVTVAASGLPEPEKPEDEQSTNPAHDAGQRRPTRDQLQAETLLSPQSTTDFAGVSDAHPSPPPREQETLPVLALIPTERASVEDVSARTEGNAPTGFERLDLADLGDDDAATIVKGARSRLPRLRNVFRRRRVRSGLQGPMSAGRRLFVLLIFFFLTALSGAIFCGFKPIAQMMAAEQAYADLCPPNSTAVNSTTGAGSLTMEAISNDGSTNNGTLQSTLSQTQLYRCAEQEASVEGLYTYALATACVITSFAGPLIDAAGPRAAHLAGSIVHLLGLVLFALHRYTLGMVMLTAGEETALLASITLAQYFPRSRAMVLGSLGALASLSALVPLCMREVRGALSIPMRSVILGYAATVGFPALLAGIAFLPPTTGEDSGGAHGDERLASLPSVQNEGSVEGRRARFLFLRFQGVLRRAVQGLRSILINPALRRTLFSRRSLYILLIFTISGMSSSYFIQGASRIFPGSAPQYLDIFFPLAAVPCALLGLIPDRLGSLAAILLLGLAGLTMNISSFGGNEVAGYVSVVALVVYISALTSQVHWYSLEAFPREFRGTITGAVLTVGGLLSLIANPLYSHLTLGVLQGATGWVRGGIGMLQLLQLLLVYLAYWEVGRQNGRGPRIGRMPRFRRRRRAYELREHPRIKELPDD